MNKNLLQKAGFEEEVERVENGECPLCAHKIEENEFRDQLSLKSIGSVVSVSHVKMMSLEVDMTQIHGKKYKEACKTCIYPLGDDYCLAWSKIISYVSEEECENAYHYSNDQFLSITEEEGEENR